MEAYVASIYHREAAICKGFYGHICALVLWDEWLEGYGGFRQIKIDHTALGSVLDRPYEEPGPMVCNTSSKDWLTRPLYEKGMNTYYSYSASNVSIILYHKMFGPIPDLDRSAIQSLFICHAINPGR